MIANRRFQAGRTQQEFLPLDEEQAEAESMSNPCFNRSKRDFCGPRV